ncbi:hypothetical protein CYMTET_13155, partial [Cymbomonas tetramitiformis]
EDRAGSCAAEQEDAPGSGGRAELPVPAEQEDRAELPCRAEQEDQRDSCAGGRECIEARVGVSTGVVQVDTSAVKRGICGNIPRGLLGYSSGSPGIFLGSAGIFSGLSWDIPGFAGDIPGSAGIFPGVCWDIPGFAGIFLGSAGIFLGVCWDILGVCGDIPRGLLGYSSGSAGIFARGLLENSSGDMPSAWSQLVASPTPPAVASYMCASLVKLEPAEF